MFISQKCTCVLVSMITILGNCKAFAIDPIEQVEDPQPNSIVNSEVVDPIENQETNPQLKILSNENQEIQCNKENSSPREPKCLKKTILSSLRLGNDVLGAIAKIASYASIGKLLAEVTCPKQTTMFVAIGGSIAFLEKGGKMLYNFLSDEYASDQSSGVNENISNQEDSVPEIY